MLGAIEQFQQETPSTSLRSASIVVYPADKANLKEFQDACQKMGGGGKAVQQVSSVSSASGNRQTRRFSNAGSGQNPAAASAKKGTTAEFQIGDLRLIVKQGDITEEKVDVIVNSSNAQLDLSRGNVASALMNKCGPDLARDCAAKVADMKNRNITSTKAYKIGCRMIVHINAEAFATNWEEGIRLCLKEADSIGAKTVALPALGTGAYGQSASQAARQLFNTVTKFFSSSSKNRSITELRVVLFDYKMIPPFVGAIEAEGNKFNGANTGVLNWFKSLVSGSSPSFKQTYSAPAVEDSTIYIYTNNRADIPKIIGSMGDVVREKFTRKEIHDEILMNLAPQEIDRIQQLHLKHKVEISVQPARGNVIVDGLQNDVYEAAHAISSILREIERRRQEEQSASMLANMVQWSLLEVTATGSKPVDYEPKENQIIEVAYQSKKKSAEIVDTARREYIIDFNSMMEYPKDHPTDSVTVLRRDKIKDMAHGSVPENWVTHSNNEHIKVVPLLATDQEYKDVEANFKATLGPSALTVSSVSRIQNRTLYQQYLAKKAHLDKQNSGIQNEQTLWHGTAADAIENINNYGFNRSYCGKNATVYGQGVYFAVNTNYSTHVTYSPPDASNNRHVYQCKVLVGHTCLGNQGLRVLPQRSGPLLYDSATNDLNKPIMYVIFNDTQAYPEYLVAFK